MVTAADASNSSTGTALSGTPCLIPDDWSWAHPSSELVDPLYFQTIHASKAEEHYSAPKSVFTIS